MHWGIEYRRLPSDGQKRLARLMIDNGVKIVIGSHPHVIEPMEAEKNSDGKIDRVVVYSLGNFISNQKDRYTDSGAMVKNELQKDENKITSITDCGYSLIWRYKYTENGKLKYTLIPSSFYDNRSDKIKPSAFPQMKQSFDDARELLNKYNINIEEIFSFSYAPSSIE
jgi:poly-gamma-glutamate synthesis protein (capsule biosynthesis protein)